MMKGLRWLRKKKSGIRKGAEESSLEVFQSQ